MGNSDWEQDKNLSPTRVVKHEWAAQKRLWNLSLEIFKTQDNQVPVQSDLTVKSALFEQEIDLDDLQRLPTFIIVLFYAF